MSRKHQLRVQRIDTIINVTSKKQEADVIKALFKVVESLTQEFEKKYILSMKNSGD